jgi:hypothetical protein
MPAPLSQGDSLDAGLGERPSCGCWRLLGFAAVITWQVRAIWRRQETATTDIAGSSDREDTRRVPGS